MLVATSVSVADERELTLLILDFALDFALDLEVAKADNLDFFSDLTLLFSLFSLLSLLASSAAFKDLFVTKDAWDCPCWSGRLDFDL